MPFDCALFLLCPMRLFVIYAPALSAPHRHPPTHSLPLAVPCLPSLTPFTTLTQTKEQGFEVWKARHSQHCYNFHFEPAGCHRDRTCSFLHADPTYSEAVAYG